MKSRIIAAVADQFFLNTIRSWIILNSLGQTNVGYPGNSKDLSKFGIFGKLEKLGTSGILKNPWNPGQPLGTHGSLEPRGTLQNPPVWNPPEPWESPEPWVSGDFWRRGAEVTQLYYCIRTLKASPIGEK